MLGHESLYDTTRGRNEQIQKVLSLLLTTLSGHKINTWVPARLLLDSFFETFLTK